MPSALMPRLAVVFTVVVLANQALRGSVRAQSDIAFPRDTYAARRVRLAAETGNAAVIIPGAYLISHASLVRQDADFWYLTGVESPYSVLVLTKRAGAVRRTLFLPEKYEFAGGQFPMADDGFRRAVWNRPVGRLEPGKAAAEDAGTTETFPLAELADRLRELVTAEVVYVPHCEEPLYAPRGFEPPSSVKMHITSAIMARLESKTFRNITPLVRRMRFIKDAYEIAALRKAAEISGLGLVTVMRSIRASMNDREVAGLMEYTWKQAGSPRAAFATVVGSGPKRPPSFRRTPPTSAARCRSQASSLPTSAKTTSSCSRRRSPRACRPMTPCENQAYELKIDSAGDAPFGGRAVPMPPALGARVSASANNVGRSRAAQPAARRPVPRGQRPRVRNGHR